MVSIANKIGMLTMFSTMVLGRMLTSTESLTAEEEVDDAQTALSTSS